MSTRPEPEQVIDLTGESAGLRYVEILTDAGIIRVHTGLVTVTGFLRRQAGRARVVVEVEANDNYHRRTPAGGNWEVEGRYGYSDGHHYEVRLTRDEES